MSQEQSSILTPKNDLIGVKKTKKVTNEIVILRRSCINNLWLKIEKKLFCCFVRPKYVRLVHFRAF